MAAEGEAEAARRDKEQTLAIAQAVREALVDRTLHEHAAHLAQINGSQHDMAVALAAVDKKIDSLMTLAQIDADNRGQVLSRRTLWIGTLSVIAAYGSMLLLLITSHP